MQRSTPVQTERAWNGLYAAAAADDDDDTQGIGQHPVKLHTGNAHSYKSAVPRSSCDMNSVARFKLPLQHALTSVSVSWSPHPLWLIVIHAGTFYLDS
jgi:hypothetical protein